MKNSRLQVRVVLLFLALALLSYAPAIGAFFVSDDFQLIKGVAEGGPFGLWTFQSGFFRPVVSVSFFLDHALWGLNPLPWHLTSLFVHVANALLVLKLAALMWVNITGRGDGKRVGIIAGLLFLLHGSHSETVAWLSGRTDLIAAFFFLSCLCAFVAFLQTGRSRFVPLIFIAGVLALGCKESAAALPLIALIIFLIQPLSPGTSRRSGWMIPVLLLLMLPVYLVVRTAFVGEMVGGYGVDKHLSLDPFRLASVMASYVFRTSAPALSGGIYTVLSWMCFGATCFAVVVGFHNAKEQGWRLYLALGISWGLSLGPAVSLGSSFFDSQGERFLYLPSIFSSIFVAAAVSFIRFRLLAKGLIILLLAISGMATFRSSQNWRMAGDFSDTILRQLALADKGASVSVVNLPDHVRGAYVFRNGLQEAWDLFIKRPREVGYCMLYAVAAEPPAVHVSKEDIGFRITWSPAGVLVPTPREINRRFSVITPFGRACCDWDEGYSTSRIFRIKETGAGRTWLYLTGTTLCELKSM